jgi:hypothetical protein
MTMFKIKDFVMKTLKGMIGNYPDFQVREYALNWYAKGVLTEEDLATIENILCPIEEVGNEEVENEEVVEETTEEV